MDYNYIDTHCHLNFKDFKDDAPELIAKTLATKTAMIIVGSEFKTSARAIEYAKEYDGVYAAIGLHPIHLTEALAENHDENGDYSFKARGEEFDYQKYLELGKNKKVVAIGETGLDYYHLDKEQDIAAQKEKQKEVFIKQLELARELKVPVIIHCREAHDDLYQILKSWQEKNSLGEKPWGVIHCFSGDLELANKYIALGLMISFTGLITFAKNWDEVIRNFPIENMMIETDSPYMAPIPFRGTRNEPKNVREVARRMGMLKSLSMEDVGALTYKNAQMIFKI